MGHESGPEIGPNFKTGGGDQFMSNTRKLDAGSNNEGAGDTRNRLSAKPAPVAENERHN
jgi:hypothetical protein